MKKLFMFLAVAGLATFGTSCGSDDSGSDPKTETLVLTATPTSAKVGETITFKVMEGTADVTANADIYVNDVKITGKTLKGDKVGDYKISAKKAGANDSNVVTVKFIDGTVEPGVKQLVLTATPQTIELNAETVFKVTLEGADVTSTSTIKVNGVAVTGGKYKGTVAGAYVAIASLANAKDSAPVTIVVKAADVPLPTTNFVSVGNTFTDLVGGALFYFVDSNDAIIKETINGKTYVPFRVSIFKDAVDGTVSGAFYDNSALLLIYVEQVTGQTGVNSPWTATAAQIEIVAFNGEINQVAYSADAETGYMKPVFVAPPTGSTDGKGSVKFSVEGNTEEDGSELKADFTGQLQGFYTIKIPASRSNSSSKSIKESAKKLVGYNGTAVRVKSIK